MEYLLTALAGAAIAVVVMRLMQQSAAAEPGAVSADIADGKPAKKNKAKSPADETVAPRPANFLDRFDRTQIIMAAAGLVLVVAAAIFALRPDANASATGATASTDMAQSAVSASAAGAKDNLGDVDSMIEKLALRLETDTNDGEGFRMLGWSYVNTGRSALAVPAYKRAVELLPGRADVHAGYGEALVADAKDAVTPAAKVQFDEAIRIDGKEPRARFFLSLYKAQNGKEREALDEWIALSNGSAADLPWQADLRQRAEKLAAKLGLDVSKRFKAAAPAATQIPADAATAPTAAAAPIGPFMSKGPDAAAVAAADKMSEGDRQQMIDGMVEGLATKLRANPDNLDGWVKLIRSRVVLEQKDKAKVDVTTARKVFAGQADKLGQINSLAAELGL